MLNNGQRSVSAEHYEVDPGPFVYKTPSLAISNEIMICEATVAMRHKNRFILDYILIDVGVKFKEIPSKRSGKQNRWTDNPKT